MRDNFYWMKKDILEKKDKSSKKSWDKHILKLCEKINSKKEYFTTSSCSGRIYLVKDVDEKAEGNLLKVWHDEIKLGELMGELEKLVQLSKSHPPTQNFLRSQARSDIIKINNQKSESLRITFLSSGSALSSKKSAKQENKQGISKNINIKFKQEPLIIHLACESLKDAQNLLNKGILAGWKRSGIISSEKKFIVELCSTEKLEFPIVHEGKILVDEEFLKIVVGKANENLKKGWMKIRKLEKIL